MGNNEQSSVAKMFQRRNLPETPEGSRPAGSAAHPCPACGTNGVVDFLDLVRGRAQMHCPRCPTSWAEQTEATMKYLAHNVSHG